LNLTLDANLQNYTVSLKPKNATFLINGGVMTVNLYKISEELIVYTETNGLNTSSNISPQTVMNWT
jgi:hypothetical protein